MNEYGEVKVEGDRISEYQKGVVSRVARGLCGPFLVVVYAVTLLVTLGYFMGDDEVYSYYGKALPMVVCIAGLLFALAGFTCPLVENIKKTPRKTLTNMCFACIITAFYVWAQLGYRNAVLTLWQQDQERRVRQNMEEGGP